MEGQVRDIVFFTVAFIWDCKVMKFQPLIDTEVSFNVNFHTFKLEFYRCNDSQKHYGVYNIKLLMGGEDVLDKLEEIEKFSPPAKKQLLRAVGNAIDVWCQGHPNQFLTFFDCLSEGHIPKISTHYFRFGFTCDGRMETWFTFVDINGKRTKFKHMLNLIDKEDFWINDLWRACKNRNYYEGDFYSPVDMLREALQNFRLDIQEHDSN